MRCSSYVAAMEMLATGTTCSLNHSVTTTTPETVRATIEPQAALGICQVFAKELRCRTKGNPHHPLTLDESLAAFEEEFKRWDGKADGLVRMAMVIESNAHWVAAGMTTEELIGRGYELARKLKTKISTHIAGGTFSIEKGFLRYLRETGRTDVRLPDAARSLEPHCVLIHGIHVTELDIEHMAHVGWQLCRYPRPANPTGAAASALRQCVARGRKCCSRHRWADGRLQRRHGRADQGVHAHAARIATSIRRACRSSARSKWPRSMPPRRSGSIHEIGSLEPGKRADIAVFDMTRPYVGVLHRPISTFVARQRQRCAPGGGRRPGRLSRRCVPALQGWRTGHQGGRKIGKKALDAAGLSGRRSRHGGNSEFGYPRDGRVGRKRDAGLARTRRRAGRCAGEFFASVCITSVLMPAGTERLRQEHLGPDHWRA